MNTEEIVRKLKEGSTNLTPSEISEIGIILVAYQDFLVSESSRVNEFLANFKPNVLVKIRECVISNNYKITTKGVEDVNMLLEALFGSGRMY